MSKVLLIPIYALEIGESIPPAETKGPTQFSNVLKNSSLNIDS